MSVRLSYAPRNVFNVEDMFELPRGVTMNVGTPADAADQYTLFQIAAAATSVGMRSSLLALRLLQGNLDAINLMERIRVRDAEQVEDLLQSA